MSLLSTLLGENNPVTQWTGRNSNLLTGLGTSLLSDGMNFQPAQVGAMMDRQVAQQRDADAKLAASTQAGSAALRKQGFIDLADAVDANALSMSDAWNEGFKRMQPGYGQSTPQNPYMSAGDGQFFNWQTGEYVTNPNAVPDRPNLPTSFQEFQLAQENPEYAATLNSSTSRPLTEGQRRNQQLGSVVEPLVSTVVENWHELTDPKNQSVGFDTPLGAPGFALTSPGYQKATNALKTIAQSYLYSVSGAAATDAETRKIVDSVTPKFGESEASANDKKALLARYVKAILDAGGAAPGAPAAAGTPGATGDTEVDSILSGLGI
jgi:hypothetical protein